MLSFAIQTSNLSRHFGSIYAVDGLNLEIPEGIVFGFLGPNGAGKTTTIRLLLGLMEPTGGHATVLGYDVQQQADEIRERSGALLEHSGLYERLSAEENLDFYGRIWHLKSAERKERIKKLLTHLDLWDRRRETVGTWSRGMKQKLAVARSLLHRPTLIFLDEPTAGLDPVAAAALRKDLAHLAAYENVTVFLTTHNLVEAENLCQLVGVIRAGKLVALGHPDTLRTKSSHPQVTISGWGFSQNVLQEVRSLSIVDEAQLQENRLIVDLQPDAESTTLIGTLVNLGVEVEEVHKSKASLEDVFLTLMNEEVDYE